MHTLIDVIAFFSGAIGAHFLHRYLRSRKKWAVVQDLRPFGYRIERTFYRERSAMRFAIKSMYLSVMPLKTVLSENKRLTDPEEVIKELDNG